MSRPYSLPEMKVDSCDPFSQHARMHQYLGSRSRECDSRQASHAAKMIGRAIWSMTEGSYRFCLECSDLMKDSSIATSLTTVSHTDLPSSSDGGKLCLISQHDVQEAAELPVHLAITISIPPTNPSSNSRRLPHDPSIPQNRHRPRRRNNRRRTPGHRKTRRREPRTRLIAPPILHPALINIVHAIRRRARIARRRRGCRRLLSAIGDGAAGVRVGRGRETGAGRVAAAELEAAVVDVFYAGGGGAGGGDGRGGGGDGGGVVGARALC